MGRKINIETQMTLADTLDSILDDLVSSYGDSKKELDEVKAECDRLNKKLKEVMEENGIKEYSTDDYKVKYIVSEKETMNEERLLSLLTTKYADTTKNFELVKMRPYIDYDAVESETYNGNIPQELLEDMNKCIDTKEVVSIRLSKEKK